MCMVGLRGVPGSGPRYSAKQNWTAGRQLPRGAARDVGLWRPAQATGDGADGGCQGPRTGRALGYQLGWALKCGALRCRRAAGTRVTVQGRWFRSRREGQVSHRGGREATRRVWLLPVPQASQVPTQPQHRNSCPAGVRRQPGGLRSIYMGKAIKSSFLYSLYSMTLKEKLKHSRCSWMLRMNDSSKTIFSNFNENFSVFL